MVCIGPPRYRRDANDRKRPKASADPYHHANPRALQRRAATPHPLTANRQSRDGWDGST